VTHNSYYILSSQFFPGSVEDHHAALFQLPKLLRTSCKAVDPKGQCH
jgi:hypothetical protein